HDGHVYLPLEECIYTMIDILNEPSITSDFLKEQISHLSTEKNLILVEDKVYLPSLYYAEDHFSAHIKSIMEHQLDIEVVEDELMKNIWVLEEKDCINYGTNQFEAIKQALNSKEIFLTRGPSTGITNVIKGILAA